MSVRKLLLVALLCLTTWPTLGVEPDEMLADPTQEARARSITRELRCVVCQNQSVDDSDAPLARDIRVLVRERIKNGDTDDEARDYIVARYGKFVLLRPPLERDTLLLWFGPAALLLGAGTLAWLYMRGLRREATAPTPLTEAEEQAVKRRLDGTAP